MWAWIVSLRSLIPFGRADAVDLHAWDGARNALLSRAHVVNDYEGLLEELASCGIGPDAAYHDENVLSAHVRCGGEDLYLLYNGNRTGADELRKIRQDTIMPAILRGEAFRKAELDVELSGQGRPFLYDLARGVEYALAGA